MASALKPGDTGALTRIQPHAAHSLLTAGLLVLCVFGDGRAAGQVFVERGAPPHSLREFCAKSGGIIVGRVVTVAQLLPPADAGPLHTPLLRYRVLVEDVIKNDGRLGPAGSIIEMVAYGKIGGGGEKGLEFPFAQGTDLVLALTWSRPLGAFTLRFGAEGVFELKNDIVYEHGASPLSSSQHQRSRGSLLADLRAAMRENDGDEPAEA
jgi:hypothetical protein